MISPDQDPATLPTVPPDPPDPPAPAYQPLGKDYLLEEVIGTGAYGKVWRGHRRADGHPVAIKVLREEYASDQVTVRRFLQEVAALRALDHPHVVRVLDRVIEGDTLAIVMELAEGESLRRAAAGGGFDQERAVAVFAQLAGALGAAHRAGIVHRDIKPENVLVAWRGGDPWARLVDFGVAQVVNGESLTQPSRIMGTPAYVAPERIVNQGSGPPVDVYALGVMAYELLGGRRPFVTKDHFALMRAHIDEEPVRPDGLTDPVWAVLRDCLEKRPEDRPTAEELADRFAALRGRTGALPPGAPPPRPLVGPEPGPAPGSAALAEPTDPAGRRGPANPNGTTDPGGSAGPNGSVGPGGTGGSVAAVGSRPKPGAALPTAGATRPVPDPPAGAPSRRRRRWLLVTLLLTGLAVAAGGAGAWFGRPERGAAPQPSPSATSAPQQLYPLPVNATSPRVGTVRLDFADVSKLPGFDSYLIWRGDTLIDQVPAGTTPPYLVPGVDSRTRYCFRVAALVVTDDPVPAAPEPACLTADGRSGGQQR